MLALACYGMAFYPKAPWLSQLSQPASSLLPPPVGAASVTEIYHVPQSAGAHDRGDVDALLFLPVLFRAYSKVATNVCQHGLMSAKENGHVPLSVRGT